MIFIEVIVKGTYNSTFEFYNLIKLALFGCEENFRLHYEVYSFEDTLYVLSSRCMWYNTLYHTIFSVV